MASSILKYGLIAVGGYLVLKHFNVDPLAYLENMVGITPATTVQPGTVNTTNVNQTDLSAGTTRTTIQKNLGPNFSHLYNFDEWNYFYQQARGIPGPDPNLVDGLDRAKKLTYDEWWSYVNPLGFSGLGRAGDASYGWGQGLGLIAGRFLLPPYWEHASKGRYPFSGAGLRRSEASIRVLGS